jgi:hypothetical protein
MRGSFIAGLGLAAAVACALRAQDNLLPNGGFEEGEKTPAGWSLSKAEGGWLKSGGAEDSACLAVSGDGKTDNAWLSGPVEFLPNRLYRFSFLVRGEGAGGGTVVSGPSFANVDIGVPGKEWTLHENVFAAPLRKEQATAPVRLGQWQMKGRALFDGARLAQVLAVHRPFGEGALGEGEKLEGNRYTFDAPLGGEGRNHSRPLLGFTAGYNTDRWCFGEGAAVTYRHEVAGRKLLSGAIEVNSGYYVSGRLVVDVSKDAKEWQHAGALTNGGMVRVEVPAALFPTDEVFVRLRGARPPCALQVHGYRFEGDMDGEPVTAAGATSYIEVEKQTPKARVQVRGLGDALPGGANGVDLRVQNATGAPLAAEARVVFSRPGEASHTNAVAVEIPGAGAFDVSVPYEVPGVGAWRMDIEFGDAFAARSAVRVPEYYDDSYGEIIPVNNPRLNLWRASSGWKIPEHRALPRQIAKALSLRVARNEWEAVQLVVAPNEALTNVTVEAAELVYGKNKIPADHVQILRVGYVPVARRTDRTGVVAAWPDPLLPQDAPATLEAGRHQPYWIRVKAPKGIPAGIYRGSVTVQAEGVKVSTGLNVEVYDFDLPDTMTCETAFGFNPGTVWRYHGATDDAQRRELLDKYLRALGEHCISPYNPAPMDGWSVTWKGMSPWTGGRVVTDIKAEGAGSLFMRDDSDTRNIGAAYQGTVKLPPKGMRIRFKHRTEAPHPFLFSLGFLRADGSWISGNNADMRVDGTPEWQTFEKVQAQYPEGAVACRLNFYAAGWQEPQGTATGDLWVDALSLADAETGRELLPDGDGAFEPFDAAAAEPVFDWTRWDAAMEKAFAEYGFNTFQMNVAGLGGGTFHARHEPEFMGYPEHSPEYDILLGKYLRGIEAHLREKGWLDKAFVYWFDEPDPKDYAFVMNGFAKLKKHAPGLRRMLTEQVEKELAGGPNLWCPLTPSLNVEGLEERRAAGDRFWWYVCCGPVAPYATEFIDHPGTELRVWLWQTWAERVAGILIWETVYWTSGNAYPDRERPQNPYLDPMSWESGYDHAPGQKRPWGNGDGRFLYPPPPAADGRPAAPVLEGPVVSLRLELLRDGIEDYEYFVILKRLLAEKGAGLAPRERANLEALLAVPADVSASLTSFTRDPAPLEAHRDKVARAIVELIKR